MSKVSRRKILIDFPIYITLSWTGLNLTGCTKNPPLTGFSFFRHSDLNILKSLSRGILGPIYPEDPVKNQKYFFKMESTLKSMGTLAQKDFIQLLDLLNFLPTRWFLTGSIIKIKDASHDEIRAILIKWRDSSLGHLNQAYDAVISLMHMSYYLIEENHAGTGYGGPPEIQKSGITNE